MTLFETLIPTLSIVRRARQRVDAVAVSPNASPLRPATILIALIQTFNAHGIGYCYWKSRLRVRRALEGASDLDLLVARADRQRATQLLTMLGFKSFPDPSWRDHPAVASFLGYDEPTGAILVVHVHFRLVAGHALLKSFRLPFEDRLIARSVECADVVGLRMLDPVDEAMLLVLRGCLEDRRDDPVALRHRRARARKYADDVAALSLRVESAALAARAREFLPAPVADAVAEAFARGEKGVADRRLRRAVVGALSVYRMHSGAVAALRAAARSASYAFAAVGSRSLGLARPFRRAAPGGGIIVAIVGADGSGKSTLGRELRTWLRTEVDARAVYFGTGDGAPSPLFWPFKALSRIVARRIKVKPKGASHGAISDRPPGPLYAAGFLVWGLAVALDKRAKLAAAHRAASRGFVVVTDRYPQDESPQYSDGPLLHRLPRCPEALRRLEASIYRSAQQAPPDLVIKLAVGPETIARREPDMHPAVIRDRIARLTELTFSGARILTIDAGRPVEDVVRAARRAVWDLL